MKSAPAWGGYAILATALLTAAHAPNLPPPRPPAAAAAAVVSSQGCELARLGEGAFFGERALIREEPRAATVTGAPTAGLGLTGHAVPPTAAQSLTAAPRTLRPPSPPSPLAHS